MSVTSPSFSTASLLALPRRSLGNFRQTFRIVMARLAVRREVHAPAQWLIWAGVWLLLAVAAFLYLDTIAGADTRFLPGSFVGIADFCTNFGLGGWYLVPAALWLVVANLTDWRSLPRRKLAAFYGWTCVASLVLAGIAFSALVVNVLKYGIGRARPQLFDEFGVLSLHPFAMQARFASFPSGHATTMGVMFGIVLLVFPRQRYIALAFAVWVALTRIFVGAHYPSDTVVGFGLGFACAVLTALVFARLGFIFSAPGPGLPKRKKAFRLAVGDR